MARHRFLSACLPAAAVLFVAACAGSPGSTEAPAAAAASGSATRSASGPAPGAGGSAPATGPGDAGSGGVYSRPLLNPAVAVTPTGTYVAWQTSAPGAAPATELARIDPATGQVMAKRSVRGGFGQAIAAAGWLWAVAYPAPRRLALLRLDPATLKMSGDWRYQGQDGQSGNVLAVAGGGLWLAAGDRLLRISLPDGRLRRQIVLSGAYSSDLAADGSGTAIVIGEADSDGRGTVQLRDPRSGALLAARPLSGVTAPSVAGPISGVVWISEPTGMQGYIQALSAGTLAPVGGTCVEGQGRDSCVTGTNAIRARLGNGLLWVTSPPGIAPGSYCADPATGRRLATAGLPDGAADQFLVLEIGPRQIFYAYAASGPGGNSYLRAAPIPAACHT